MNFEQIEPFPHIRKRVFCVVKTGFSSILLYVLPFTQKHWRLSRSNVGAITVKSRGHREHKFFIPFF